MITKILQSVGVLEVIVFEAIIFCGLWAYDDYIAGLVTAIFVPIFFAVFVISLISEMLDKSKVPAKFFFLMFALSVTPLAIYGIVQLIQRI